MKWVVQCSVNWVGCDETIIVEADNESEAEEKAAEYWDEMVAATVAVEGIATDDDLENGYPEID